MEKDPMLFEDWSNVYVRTDSDPVNFIDFTGEGKFGLVIRIGKWGLKHIKTISKDEAKRLFRKGKDISGNKKALKTMAKSKGKGKPITEKHGQGTDHWHRPDRTGGHGFENKCLIPGATLGKDIAGDNLVGRGLDFFNPFSDAQEIVDFLSEDSGD